MRVVILCETFSKKMGYLSNALPKYMAKLGADVHVVSADLLPYYQIKDFDQTYQGFTGNETLTPGTVERHDGFTLHIVGHRKALGYIRMVGLRRKLQEIKPDIVQTMAPIGWLPLDAALLKLQLGYKLFTGNHTHASVFPLATRPHHLWSKERLRSIALRAVPGYAVSLLTSKCYATAVDCADVAVRFFGVPRQKVEVCPLGVDTERFQPISGEAEERDRQQLRAELGFSEGEIVCIYSGRFSSDKNPLLLAQAIARLVERGGPYRGLFVGNGTQAAAIKQHNGCVVHPFVPVSELPRFFRAAEIGVWPTQESMSMLDAAACGLPIVVNDTLKATERINGNGRTYRLNDCDDLIQVLLSLRSPDLRRSVGSCGADKMRTEFSWESIAERRLRDYAVSLNSRLRE